jgi:hypothetical protein
VLSETGVAMDDPSATTLSDRTAIVSLSNSLGTLSAGRDKHSVTRALDNFDVLENTYGTIVGSIHSAQGSRVQNAVFVSITPIAGFTGNYQLANSETAGVSNTQAGSIDYTVGSLSATVARYDDTISSASTIAVKYTLGTGTTLFGLYSEDKVSGVSTTGKSVGVRQLVTLQLALLANYGEKSDGANGKAIGVAYALHKSLTFHARYSVIDNVGTSTDVTQYGAGIEFNF